MAEPQQEVLDLAEPITPIARNVEQPLESPAEEPKKEYKALIDYQGTVRVPFLEEINILSPYKGEPTTLLELGPSVQKLGSMATGAVEGISPYVSTFIEAMSSPFTKPLYEKEEDPVREEARQRKLKRTLEVAKKFDQTLAEKKEKTEAVTEQKGIIDPSVAFLRNTGSDIKEVLYGLATIFNETVGIQARETATPIAEVGKKFGKEMAEGLALITGATFAGAEEVGDIEGAIGGLASSFTSRPLTTVLTILPVIQAAKRVAPLRQSAITADSSLGKIWQASNSTIPWETIKAQVNNIPGVKRTVDFLNKKVSLPLKRTLEDPTVMETAAETKIAEAAIDDPRRVQEKVAAKTARLAREIAAETPEVPQSLIPQLAPEELELYRRTSDQIGLLDNKPKIGSKEAGFSSKDTGKGEAFIRAAEAANVPQQNIPKLLERASEFYNRLQVRDIANKAEVMKAALVELLIESGGDLVIENAKGKNVVPSIMGAMERSLRRKTERQVLTDQLLDISTVTTKKPPIITEVFEVTKDGVVRQPKARQALAEQEAAQMLIGRETFYESAYENVNVEPKWRNIARKELAEMTERTIEVQPRTEARTPTSPTIEEVVSYVHKQVSKLFPEYNKALYPDAPILLEQSPYSRRTIRRRITEALDQETVSLLRDPKVALKVKQTLASAAKRAGVPFFARRKMLAAMNDFIADTATQVNETTFPQFQYEGKTFFGKDDIYKVYESLTPKQKRAAVEFATTRIGWELSSELETIKMVGALNAENNRFVTPQNISSPDIYAVQMAAEVVGNGATRPLIIPHNAKQVAASLRAAAVDIGEAIASKNDLMTKEGATSQVLELAKHIEQFVPMKRINNIVERSNIRGITLPEKLDNSYAYAPYEKGIFWDVAAKQGALAGGAFDTVVGIGNLFKRNVVSRSTPSLVNNNISNVLALSARRGVPAPMVIRSIVSFNNKLHTYLQGKKPAAGSSPKQQLSYELLRSLDDEGLFSTNDVRKDFVNEAKKQKAYVSPLAEKLLSPLDRAQSFFEYTYTRYGDDVFKGEASYVRGEKALKQLEQTRTGYDTRFENNQNSHWVVKKTSPTTYEGTLYGNGGEPLQSKFVADITTPAGRAPLMKVIARDGLFTANELYFDYGKVGNWTKILRSLPVTNLTSSFHTWFFKALDIPFVKKGLVYKTLLQTDTIPSTDPVIIRQNQAADAALSARRAIIANSSVGAGEQNRDKKEARAPLSFSPSRQELAFIVATTNPEYVLQYALGSRDYTDPTSLGLKAIQKLLLAFRNDEQKMKELFPPREKLDEMTDAEWEKLQKQRSLFTKTMDGTILSPKEALELAGIGGSIALSFYDYIRDAEEQGKIVDLPTTFRNFGKTFLGSNVARAADIAIATGVEQEILPSFMSQYTRLGKSEMRRGYRSGQTNPNQSNLLQYAIKEAFGVGWNSIQYLGGEDPVTGRPTQGAMKRYVDGIAKELMANMVRPKQNEARRMKARADAATSPQQEEYLLSEYERLTFEAEQMEDYIKTQRDLYSDQLERAWNNVYWQNKPEE